MGSGWWRVAVRAVAVVVVLVLVWKIRDYACLPSPDAHTPNFPVAVGEQQQKTERATQFPAAPHTAEELEVKVSRPLRVEVYYEALCPDSRYFITRQLTPTFTKLQSIMTLALVPYGKARTSEKDGKVSFGCQHGPEECQANMVHACVTNQVKDEAKSLAIIHCMIDNNRFPMKVGKKCVEQNGEDWAGVEACVSSEKGTSIMKHMGEMTHSLRPRVEFIPTITIDGTQKDQKHILRDIHEVLCKRYTGPDKPSSC